MKLFVKTLLLSMVVVCFTFCAHAADNLLLNSGFESYDSETKIPDHWTRLEGRQLTVNSDYAHQGDVGLYLFGGTAKKPEDNPWGSPIVTGAPVPPSGVMAQVIDLSPADGWGTTNWLEITTGMAYNLKNCKEVIVELEYLPASYDTIENLAVDDPAWDSSDVTSTLVGLGYSTTDTTPWRDRNGALKIPTVRWARMVIRANVECKKYGTLYADGKVFAALDEFSLTAEPYVFPLSPPDPDNLLLNGDFEAFDPATGIPEHWHVLKGMVTAMDTDRVRPVSGDRFAGHPGGMFSSAPQENTDVTSSLVQVVDLANLPQWADADYLTFSMGCLALEEFNAISRKLILAVEYLPADFNDTEITWDSDAWETSGVTPVSEQVGTDFWKEFTVPELPLVDVRWIRVRLNIESRYVPDEDPADHRSGFFDRVSFTARTVINPSLVKNPGFEITDGNGVSDWHSPEAQGAALVSDQDSVYEGTHSLGLNAGTSSSKVYQVIDLKDNITFWKGGLGTNGALVDYPFIQYAVSAQVANLGGKKVAVGIEHLPDSYNGTEDIAWNDPAWATSQWESDGTEFTNNGGDAIDSGEVICETGSGTWRSVEKSGWLPRARWIRLRIEFEADPAGANALVALDNISMAACCKVVGPYSGYGPDKGYPEAPDAPDRGIPGWIGPEGEGNCGGYTGQSKRNYVNPAFAGFADDYQDYITSGQNIGMPNYDIKGVNITGAPFTDAGWQGVIVTTGDMDLAMLADYFGPAPSGDYRPGEITAVFNEAPITNGEGPDFACFENGFISGWGSPQVWAELSFVEVSSNGTDFVRFPTHSLTPKWPGGYGCLYPQGLFGFVGKHVNAYGSSYGTPFDLDWIADHELVLNGTVDLNDIRYVKMVDIPGGGPKDAKDGIVSMFTDSYGLPVFDSWVTWGTGGSDLDAVGVLNTTAPDSDGDGIADFWDNCPNTPNPKQFNTDKKKNAGDEAGDNYGNACDCDLNQDDVVDTIDYAEFRKAWGSYGPVRIQGAPGQPDTWEPASSNWNPNVDFNGDFKVNGADFQILKKRWGQTAPFK